MLITEEYRKLNALKHETSEKFGAYGYNIADKVRAIAKRIGAHTILDYGCGKRTLERALGFAIQNYDPAIAGLDAPPEPADLVVCCDVMEHIEPECLDDVLADLERVTKNIIFFVVDCKPANKIMADGTNAHRIIEPAKWWLPKLMDRFELETFQGNSDAFMAIMIAKRALQ